MAAIQNPSLSKRIWAGDTSAVDEARKHYHENKIEGLIPYAVALYSFRSHRRFREELFTLRHPLIVIGRKMMGLDHTAETLNAVYADKADVISTHLEWILRHADLTLREADEVRSVARVLVADGQKFAERSKVRNSHTELFLRLTGARLLMSENRHVMAGYELDHVAAEADAVPDTNQRCRIYRKLGLLLRMEGELRRGIRFGLKACIMGGIPPAVRAKSVAALFHIGD